MSKKKNCRYTQEERAIHEEAVRLRKMTDKQLVSEFHRAADTEMVTRVSTGLQDGADDDRADKYTTDVQKLLKALSEGRAKGIKGGISYKVAQLAEEMGLV